jgi:hypothetical protein
MLCFIIYIFQVYHNYFYIFTKIFNKTNGQTCITEIEECLYLETEGVFADTRAPAPSLIAALLQMTPSSSARPIRRRFASRFAYAACSPSVLGAA